MHWPPHLKYYYTFHAALGLEELFMLYYCMSPSLIDPNHLVVLNEDHTLCISSKAVAGQYQEKVSLLHFMIINKF